MLSLHSHGQQVVIDPSQIAASATNAAEQVDYMLDQLGELAHLGEQMSTVRDHFDSVFGEDGIGGKTIDLLEDLGTLTRLTQSYNSTIQATERYARQIEELGRFRLSDANMMLSYMLSMKRQLEMAIETARKILTTLGFSKKEKKEEVEKIIKEIEDELSAMDAMMEIETEATLMAEGLSEFIEFIDDDMDTENYIQAKSAYGDIEDAGEGSLGIISIILGLFSIMSVLTNLVIMVRGGIAGDPVANNALYRVMTGIFIGSMMLNLIGAVFGFNL